LYRMAAPSSAEVLLTLEELAGEVFISTLRWPTAEIVNGDVELFCGRVRVRVAMADRLGLERLHCTRIGLALLDEPAPLRCQVAASRCLRYLGGLSELTRANDALLTLREIIFNVFINATRDPGLDREQILRELFLAIRDELRMYDRSRS
jgi:hypothetical protein